MLCKLRRCGGDERPEGHTDASRKLGRNVNATETAPKINGEISCTRCYCRSSGHHGSEPERKAAMPPIAVKQSLKSGYIAFLSR